MNENLVSVTGSTLLIIDDRPHNLLFLSTLLIKQGYKLRKALTGAAAIKTVQTKLPDLILLKMHLRGMSGYEVCAALVANPATCSIPIIFMDVPTQFDDVVKIFAVGAADYITEPIKVEEVLVRVNYQLTIKKLQTQLAKKNAKLRQEILGRKRAEYALKKLNKSLSRSSAILQRGQV
ncbi:response regulator [Microseira sp. BLCC-F43]|uniref:response regulator n=1 Tax=Microseira sp. BLCC-F43 TaxID=3153602 RepID=UPI0035BA6142